MRARHLLALGPRLLGLRQPGGELAVLAVFLIPLQGHAHGDRDHVGEGLAALAVHQRRGPVHALVLAGDFGRGQRHGFLRGHQGDVRVPGKLMLEAVCRQPRRRDRRRIAQRRGGEFAHPARELGGRIGLARLRLADPVLDAGHARSRHEHVGLRAAAGAVGRVGRFDLQGRLVALLRQQRDHLLLVVAVEPRERGAASQFRKLHRARGLCRIGLALETRRAGPTLVRAGEGLRQADRAHGHEVVGQAEAHRSVDGQVVDRQAQHRVGQALGRDGQLPRRAGRRILCDQGVGARLRCVQRRLQGQRLGGRCDLRGGLGRGPAGKSGREQRCAERAQDAGPARERVFVLSGRARAHPFQWKWHRLNPNESGAAAITARTNHRLGLQAPRRGPKRQTGERIQMERGGRQTPVGSRDRTGDSTAETTVAAATNGCARRGNTG